MTTDKPELDREAIEALRILFQELVAQAEDLRRERDVLAGVVAGVRELHFPIDGECSACHTEHGHAIWPCPTIQALSAGGGAE